MRTEMTFKIKDGPKQIFAKNLSRSVFRDGNELVRIPKPIGMRTDMTL